MEAWCRLQVCTWCRLRAAPSMPNEVACNQHRLFISVIRFFFFDRLNWWIECVVCRNVMNMITHVSKLLYTCMVLTLTHSRHACLSYHPHIQLMVHTHMRYHIQHTILTYSISSDLIKYNCSKSLSDLHCAVRRKNCSLVLRVPAYSAYLRPRHGWCSEAVHLSHAINAALNACVCNLAAVW